MLKTRFEIEYPPKKVAHHIDKNLLFPKLRVLAATRFREISRGWWWASIECITVQYSYFIEVEHVSVGTGLRSKTPLRNDD